MATEDMTVDKQPEQVIDEGLYSRQLYVLGHDAMKRMAASNVLVVGLKGLGAEIAKNVALAGVKTITIFDPTPTTIADLSTQFFLRPQDASAGTRRDHATLPRLAELNTYVPIRVLDQDTLTKEVLERFQVVVLSDSLHAEQVKINDLTTGTNTHFISAQVRGLFGAVFNDFGPKFLCNDPTGEQPLSGMVVDVASDKEGLVTLLDETRHGLEDGDYVTFTEVQGMEELNDSPPRKITVKGPYTFTIGNTEGLGKYKRGGLFKQHKMPKEMSFKSLRESTKSPEILIADYAKFDRPAALHAAFQALSDFKDQNGRLPRPRNAQDADQVLELTKQILQTSGQDVADMPEKVVRELAFQAKGDLSPMVAYVGGFVAQEVLKACSGKFHPLVQHMYVDSLESLPDSVPGLPESEFAPQNSRYDGQIAVLGQQFQNKIANARQFLVGSGAIGCEMLKNWSMMGLGSGPEGVIHVTDMDTIEKSNLNRQFLFRPKDVGHFKADTAAAAVAEMNPDLKGKIHSHQNRVGPETEDVYGDEFFSKLTGVTNALDNVQARQYMDRRCVYYEKPLLESGTLGTKANTQVVVPHLTESYSSSQDPPEKSIPVCTLKNFPNAIEHTIQWAREQFDEFFLKPAETVNLYLSQPDFIETTIKSGSGAREQLEQIKQYLVDTRPTSFEQCIYWARMRFEENYHNNIRQLLHSLPADAVTSSGQPFWAGPKRAPTPLSFDVTNPTHFEYVVSAANLHAQNYGFKGESDPNVFVKVLTSMTVPTFVPKENVKIQVTENEAVNNNSSSNADGDGDITDVSSSLPDATSLAGFRLQPIEMEKDDDTNHHMDFITAASNLRALNYGISPADKHQTKGIAGKIIPAIATTTALATGLVNLELYKLLDEKKELDVYSNAFVNLALPFIAFSDPIAAAKLKYNETEWTLWSRFKVERDITLQEFLDLFENEHGLQVSMLSSGVSMLFSSFLAAKKRQERLSMKMSTLIETVSKKPIPSHTHWVIVEIMADDREGEDVEVPFVAVKVK